MDIKLKCSLQSWAFMEVTATRKKPMNNAIFFILLLIMLITLRYHHGNRKSASFRNPSLKSVGSVYNSYVKKHALIREHHYNSL